MDFKTNTAQRIALMYHLNRMGLKQKGRDFCVKQLSMINVNSYVVSFISFYYRILVLE